MGEAEGGEGVKGLRSSVLGSCSSRGATLAGFFFLSFFFCLLVSLGPHLQHMEVPRLGGELEL